MTEPAVEETEAPLCLGRCGNRLTSAESVARGYGERCWRKLHGRHARRPRTASPAAEVGDGQTELPLYDHQPTLWSA